MTFKTETVRQLVDMAVAAGRARQSLQTGYIHHFYHPQNDEAHLTIPLIENFLFVLALLRTKTVENMTEAKEMLEKLLNFQNWEEGMHRGNFPIYLHDYPSCKDRFLGAALLPIFYWIHKEFHHVLGNELKSKFESSINALLQHSLKTHYEKAAPYPIGMKIAAAAHAFGTLFGIPAVQSHSQLMLEEYRNTPEMTSWCTPAALADILIALQMVYPSISKSPWKALWDHLESTWHQHTSSYCGPAVKESQQGFEPQVTPYDLFAASFTEKFSARALVGDTVHLYGALVQQTEDRFFPASYPVKKQGMLGGNTWQMEATSPFACSTINKQEALNPSLEKAFHPFKLVWGSQKRLHTLVCQGGNSDQIIITPDRDIVFTLRPEIFLEDREKNREVIFFVDMHEECVITVSGHAANTFRLEDKILIRSGEMVIELTFRLTEGEGDFMGHIMPGNRPSQLALKGSNRFAAYDKQLFLRTLRRSPACKITASIKILQ